MSFVTSQGDIADTARRAVTALKAIIAKDESDHDQGGDSADQHRYSDELQRLEIWMGDQGTQDGRLDYRLREASSLRETVLSNLEGILQATESTDIESELDGAITLVSTTNSQIAESQSSDPSYTNKDATSASISSGSSNDRRSSGIDTNISVGDSVPDSPIAQIHDYITYLLDLGPSLLDPAPSDRVYHEPSFNAAQPDLDHAHAKFPKADPKLVERIGIANWERRQSLRNLRSDCEKNLGPSEILWPLRSGYCDDDDQSLMESSVFPSGMIAAPPESLMSSSNNTETVVSTFNDSGIGTLSTMKTDFSAAPSLIAQAKVGMEQRYKIPLPPHPNDTFSGDSFLCPYCFRRLSAIDSLREWRKHVFEDLQPYMCTYGDCTLPMKTYGNKKVWWEHETERHRVKWSWVCAPCTREQQHPALFKTSELFDNHVREHHPVLTHSQLQGIRKICQQRSGVSEPHSVCPLCREELRVADESGEDLERVVRKHIADHLEQLAFFVAFPAGQLDIKDEDVGLMDDSDSEAGKKTEIESIVTDDRYLSKQEVRIANVYRFMADQTHDRGRPAPSRASVSGDTRPPQEPSRAVENGSAQPVFPICMLMHPPNEHFYGRESLVADASAKLTSGSIVVFHGVGGIGKTLSAIELVYRHQDQYDAIFWLQADTAPGLSDSYLQMVTALGLNHGTGDHLQAIDRGRYWLEETDKRWLVVFDNVLTWESIAPFMPNSMQDAKGSVLITTQHAHILKDSFNITKMRLDPLNQDSGSEMLLRYLDKDIETDPERHLAREISAFVGGLPVAIAHVAGYAEFSSYSLEDLIEIFREWRKRTGVATDEADDLPVAFREAAFSYDETLAMVWNVTLRELSADAQNIMYILSYLNCEAVPESMLFIVREDAPMDFPDFREPRRVRITKRSLINRRLMQSHKVEGEECFSIHRSLQRGIRETLSRDTTKQQLVFGQAVALVREVFPRSNPLQQPMPEKWTEFQRLLPHLHALHDVYNKYKHKVKGSIDFAQLLQDAGMDQFERGITKEGLLLLKTAEDVLDSFSTDEYELMRADIHAMIGIGYDNTGIEMRADCMRRRQIALEIRKKAVENSTDPRRNDEILLYNSWMEYAIALLHYNRFEEAEPVIEECLHKYKLWAPENEIPFEYAKYYHKIGLVRMYQGRFQEAIELATRGAQLMGKTGYEVFETRFRFDLACIILQTGDVDHALKVHHDIFTARRKKLGLTNELTRHSRYALGAIYEMKGNLEEAEFHFKKALYQRSVSPWPDEASSRAQFHLANVLLRIGRPEDVEWANNLREKALKVLDRLLPLDYPPELESVDDKGVLFDHLQTVMGARFTGRGLLECFMKKKDHAERT